MNVDVIPTKIAREEKTPEAFVSKTENEARLRKLQKARQLVEEPGYPSPETIEKLAEILYERCVKEDR